MKRPFPAECERGLALRHAQACVKNPGVLSVLPTLDVTALEQGMRHFLRQLQGVSEDLTGKRDKPGMGVWLVAGTAAAAACEIARRQMAASRRRLAVEMNWIAGAPPDHLFGE